VSGPPAPPGNREARLLLTTLAVSLFMLLVLAGFRFPRPPAALPPAPPPAAALERLAARATYGELAAILAGVQRQVGPSLVGVHGRERVGGPAAMRTAGVPAVRIGGDRAVALVGPGRSPDDFAVSPDVEGIVALDVPRGIALVKVPPSTAPPPAVADASALEAPGYAAAVESTARGPAVRPFYFGRVDREENPRWNGPVLRFTGLQQVPPDGSAIFLLDGRFLGLGATAGRGFVVVPAALLNQSVERLQREGSIAPGDLGVEVVALTGDLGAALSAASGVVVSHVLPTGPSQGVLRPGDVIQRLGGRDIQSIEELDAAVAQTRGGQEVPIEVRRRGEPLTVQVKAANRGWLHEESSRQLGLDLRRVAGDGVEVVRVEPRSAAALAGIVTGDVITLFDRTAAPTPAEIARDFRQAAAGSRLVVGVERARQHLMLVLTRP
jgi:hypothetical protein